MWLSEMCHILFGDASLAVLPPAPPRNTLLQYGGHLTLQEYRGPSFRGRVQLLSRPIISYPVVAHIAPTQGQLGQVTGLRRPTQRRVRSGPTAAEPKEDGLLDSTPIAPEGKKEEAPRRLKGGGLSQFLK